MGYMFCPWARFMDCQDRFSLYEFHDIDDSVLYDGQHGQRGMALDGT
jgi:hypothetical protein